MCSGCGEEVSHGTHSPESPFESDTRHYGRGLNRRGFHLPPPLRFNVTERFLSALRCHIRHSGHWYTLPAPMCLTVSYAAFLLGYSIFPLLHGLLDMILILLVKLRVDGRTPFRWQ